MPFAIGSMPDLRFFRAHLPKHKDSGSDFAGVKRSFELSTAHLSSGEDVWTGANVDNIRKLTLEWGLKIEKRDKIFGLEFFSKIAVFGTPSYTL